MIVNVEVYPEFVPYCVGCVLQDLDLTAHELAWLEAHPAGSVLLASTSVGFKAFKETYLSRIKCLPNERVEAYSTEARLFQLLLSVWELIARPDGSCEIRFSTEFEFKSALYSRISAYFLDYVSTRQVDAFVERLARVYGKRAMGA